MHITRITAFILLTAALLPIATSLAEYTLVWSDEFDGPDIDPANWEFMYGDGSDYGNPGWGNNEWQWYTDRSENCYISGGQMHIAARRDYWQGHEYTSARLRTLYRADFLYGRIEASIKLPSTQGIWPAFWMLPTDSPYGGWAASGEIDIMESINTADRVYGTIHYGGTWPENVHSGGDYADGTDYSADFHTYTLQWEPDAMLWYVDGQLYYAVTSSGWYSDADPGNTRAPFDNAFHMLLNVAVGGNWPGYPDGSSVFPQELVIDWVRIYQDEAPPPEQQPYHGTPLAIPGRIELEDFDIGADGVAYHDCDAANNGGQYRPSSGVDIEECGEGGYNVGWLCETEWLEYTVDIAIPGPYIAEARVASQSTGGPFSLELDETPISSPFNVPVTGGWQTWTTISREVILSAGEHVLRFANGGTSEEYNINWLAFYAFADINRDFAVDVLDLGLSTASLSGPDDTTPPAGVTPTEFANSDFDGDGDVDVLDAAEFQYLLGS